MVLTIVYLDFVLKLYLNLKLVLNTLHCISQVVEPVGKCNGHIILRQVQWYDRM